MSLNQFRCRFSKKEKEEEERRHERKEKRRRRRRKETYEGCDINTRKWLVISQYIIDPSHVANINQMKFYEKLSL